MDPAGPTAPRPDAVTCARVANGLLAAMTLASVAAFTYGLYLAEPSLPFDPDKLVAEVRERLVANAGAITAEAADFAADTAPPVSRAVLAEVRESVPVYLRAIRRQGEPLVDDLANRLEDDLRGRARAFLARHRAVFREEFPELTDDRALDRLVARFERAFERVTDRYYFDEFRREAGRTAAAWDRIPPAELPAGVGPGQQLLEYAADWAVLRATDRAVSAAGGGQS